MVIVVTRFCNTDSCTYCHVHTRDFDVNAFNGFSKDDGTVEKILALAEASGDFELRFFGGEPLMRKDVVMRMVAAIDEAVDSEVGDAGFGTPTFGTDRRRDESGIPNRDCPAIRFVINTNLLMADSAFFDFCEKYRVKLIVSCNGDPFSHSLTRGISLDKTALLYDKIREMLVRGIEHQINLVFQPETADRFEKNLRYVAGLGGANINLLPASYVEGWKSEHVGMLNSGFSAIESSLASGELSLTFENLRSSDAVHLFKSELVVDSDGNVYPNMVVMEDFFLDKRSKVKIASILEDSPETLKEKVAFYYGENSAVYDAYVNKFLEKEFSGTLPEEYPVRDAFNAFLDRIARIP